MGQPFRPITPNFGRHALGDGVLSVFSERTMSGWATLGWSIALFLPWLGAGMSLVTSGGSTLIGRRHRRGDSTTSNGVQVDHGVAEDRG